MITVKGVDRCGPLLYLHGLALKLANIAKKARFVILDDVAGV
jgi:hypothetical protein